VSVNSGGTIQQISSSGVVSVFASGLTHPTGLAFGPDGNLYVSEDFSGSNTGVVSQVTSGGTVTSFASNLFTPLGLAFNGTDLYIADYVNNRIAVVSSGGGVVSTFASPLNSPFGVAFDSSGNLFVANRDNGTVVKVDSLGTVTAFAAGFNQPNDLAFDSSGELFVSNFGNNTISKISADGNTITTFADSGDGLNSPLGLAFNPVTGDLFVANSGLGQILDITSAGDASIFASGLSGVQYLAFEPAAVPEPAMSGAIAAVGALGFAVWWRRRRTRRAASARV
jgi:DNA-binding beta-propeller fold protein YncE